MKNIHHFPRLLRTHHFKLAIIAAALTTLSLFVSLTAYLTTYTDEPSSILKSCSLPFSPNCGVS